MNLSSGVAINIKTYHLTLDKWIDTFIMLSKIDLPAVIACDKQCRVCLS